MNDIHPECPVCVPCGRNMKCQENGVLVRLTEDQIAAGDLFECERCDHQLIIGFGSATHRWEGKSFQSWDKAMGEARIYSERSQSPYLMEYEVPA